MTTLQSENTVSTSPVNTSATVTQNDTVKTVTWTSNSLQTTSTWDAAGGLTDTQLAINLNGTLVIVVAATALFATFVLSGISFTLVSPGGAGTTSYNFTYSGTQSAAYIQSLLVSGANITFNS